MPDFIPISNTGPAQATLAYAGQYGDATVTLPVTMTDPYSDTDGTVYFACHMFYSSDETNNGNQNKMSGQGRAAYEFADHIKKGTMGFRVTWQNGGAYIDNVEPNGANHSVDPTGQVFSFDTGSGDAPIFAYVMVYKAAGDDGRYMSVGHWEDTSYSTSIEDRIEEARKQLGGDDSARAAVTMDVRETVLTSQASVE